MKRHLCTRFFLFLICLFIVDLLPAQQNWRWQNPKPHGNEVKSMVAPDSNTIIIAGAAGTIIKTKDGGESWALLETGIKADLHGISFLDNQLGFAVGEDGTIMRTKDCGDSWEKLVSGRNDTLRGVSVLSSKHIIAVGDTGTILRSSDGGDSWIYQPYPGLRSNLNDVYFPRPDFGLIIGDSMGGFGGPPIIFSGDTGVSFTPWGNGNTDLAGKSFNALWMPKGDPNKAVIVGDKGTIVSTVTAGTSWEIPILPTIVDIHDVWFFDGDNGFASGPEGLLLRTRDCGKTWTALNPPFQRNILAMAIPKDSTVYFGGGFGGLFKTPDGGSSFSPVQSGFFPNLTSVAFLDDSFGIAVGGQGAILRTENGGRIWDDVPPVTFDDMESVTRAEGDSTVGKFWMAGGKFGGFARIYCSSDTGKSWQPQTVFSPFKFFDITFQDSLNGIAVGLSGVIFCTRNGGKTWVQKTSGTNKWLLDVDFGKDSSAYAVGGEGTILHSSNWGDSWQPLNSNTQEWLTAVSFLDDSFGIAVGNRGVILRTSDAGQHWDNISFPKINIDYTSVSLFRGSSTFNKTESDSIEVVVSGYNGTILFSPDAGNTWIEQDSRTKHPLTDSYFSSPHVGTAVGAYGTILRTTSKTSTVGLEDSPWDEWQSDSPLGLNYPNPFSTSTRLPFSISYSAPVDLRIFDLQGQMVARLVNEELNPGNYEYEWEPRGLAEGLYVCRLQIGYKGYTRKIILKR